MTISQPKYKLLSNSPCGEDKFEGQSHAKIASQIADLIQNRKDCNIIGIEGSWGSGKSNLVKLSEQELNKVNDITYKFYTYDAWGHITDHQRRSIIEELADFLKEDLQPTDKWESKRIQLLSKTKNTITKDIPNLNGFLAMVVIIILFHPIINDLIGLLNNGYSTPTSKVIIEIIVYFVLLCIGYQWYRDQQLASGGDSEDNKTSLLSELFALYSHKTTSTTTFEQIQEEEPSSREFRDWMKDINDSLPSGMMLVLVFDNMDRLPSEKVREFWAAIHSMFSTDANFELDKIKVIIPFDREHVNQAFATTEENNMQKYGNDFIDKTFDVIFRVSPIIMTAWKDYFSERWTECFNQEVTSDVLQIFDALESNKTPRRIIAFINECVTIKSICNDVPERYVTLFCFGKEKITKNPVKEILSPDFLGSLKFLYENDPDISKYLSAIYYQLPVEKAIDVVMVSQLVRDLDNNRPENYISKGRNETLIIHLLENAIPQITNVENAVCAFKKINLGETSHKDILWNCLCEKELTVNRIISFKPYQKDILLHTKKRKEYAHLLISGYTSNINNFSCEQYKDAIDQLSESIEGDEDVIFEELEKQSIILKPEKFLQYLKILQGDFKVYGISYDKDELDEYLGKVECEGLKNIIGINYLLKNDEKPEVTFKLYTNNLKQLITKNKSNIHALNIIYSHIKEIKRPVGEEYFLSDVDVCALFDKLKDHDEPLYYDLIALRISRLNNFNPNNYSYQSTFNNILNTQDKEIVRGIAQVVEYYINYGDLLLNISKINYPLVKNVLQEITIHPQGISRMALTDVLRHYDDVLKNTGLENDILFNRLNGWINSYNELDIESLSVTLLKDALASNSQLSSKIESNVYRIYVEATQEDWKESMVTKGKLYHMWLLYHPENVQNCFDAFKSILKGIANGEQDVLSIEEANSLISIFSSLEEDLEYLMNEIYDLLTSKDTKSHLLYFTDWLIEYCSKDKLKDFLNDLVPTDIIDEEVANYLLQRPQILYSHRPKGFKAKLEQLYNTSMHDNEKLRHFLRIKKDDKK